MKILILNGSPKGGNSNTLKLASAFVEGMSSVYNYDIDLCHIRNKSIEHCLGCFSCWNDIHGKCIINDDMGKLIERYIHSDYVIWSMPLYYFGMPSKMKAFMDRLLPTNLPQIVKRADGTGSHPQRYDLSAQKHILISTCGFYSTARNYEALCKQFELAFGGKLIKILCPEGELFGIPQLVERTEEYLSHVRNAGREYAQHGIFSQQVMDNLNVELFPAEKFIEMANAHWKVHLEPKTDETHTPDDEAYFFLQKMAAVYRPRDYKTDIVIEMCFTDIGKTYQLVLGKEHCTLTNENFTPYTTRVETPFSLWRDISEGKANGPEALMNQEYRVLGKLSVLQSMRDYFLPQTTVCGTLRTSMHILLLPWLVFWILLPSHTHWGAVAGLVVCAFVPLASFKYKLTLYDAASSLLVSLFCLATLLGAEPTVLLCLSYLLFGGIWSLSGFAKIPITAHYSCNAHGGETAFTNPLFIKTNRILSIAWGVLYLVVSICSYFIMQSALARYLGIINFVVPSFMGVFTIWFIKWYPAKLARRGIKAK